MRIKKILPFVLALVIAIAMAGCSKNGKPAIVVNGETITMAEYERVLENTKMQYQQQGVDFSTAEGKMMETQLKTEVINSLIYQELLQQEAEKKGYSTSSQEVDTEYNMLRDQFGDDKQFNEVLKANKITGDELRKQLSLEILIEKFIEGEFSNITLTEEEVQSGYDRYNEEVEDFPSLEEVRVELEEVLIAEKKDNMVFTFLEDIKAGSEIDIKIQ